MSKRLDSVIGHCLLRATAAEHDGGSMHWAAIKATPKASRVAGFIVQWAAAMRDAGGPIDLHGYMETWAVPERTAYRHLRQFRELWPEYSTPEPIAKALVAHLDARELERSGPLAQVSL